MNSIEKVGYNTTTTATTITTTTNNNSNDLQQLNCNQYDLNTITNKNIEEGINIGNKDYFLKDGNNLNLISVIPINKKENVTEENSIKCNIEKIAESEAIDENVVIEDTLYKYDLKIDKNIPIKTAQNYFYKTYFNEKDDEKQTKAPFKIIKKKNIPMHIHINHSILNNIYRDSSLKKDIYADNGLADADEEDHISTNHLPLELFDDPDFEIFTPKEWLQLRKIYLKNFDINKEPEIQKSIKKLKDFNSVFHLKLQNLNYSKSEEYNNIINRILNNEKIKVDEEYLGYDEEVVKFLIDLKKKEKEYFDNKRKEYFKTKEFEIELDKDDTTQEIKELRIVAKYLIDAKENCTICANSKDCIGVKAFSRYFYHHKYKPEVLWDWERCWVIDYDEDTKLYTIHWAKTHINKKVKRLNLFFEIENKEYFYKRVDTANLNRETFEKDKEYYNMIDTQTDSSQFGSLPQFLINGIIKRVNIPICESQINYMKYLISIINEDYIFSMKKNDYEFYNGKYELENNQISKKNLVFAKQIMDAVNTPFDENNKEFFFSIAEKTKELSQIFFGANVKIQSIIIDIFGKLHNKIINLMHFNKETKFPISFLSYEKKVKALLKTEQMQLSTSWPNAIASYIETDLSDIFNFNMIDEKEYLNSRCRSFLSLISLIMEEELKKFIIHGIHRLTELFGGFLFSDFSNSYSLDTINEQTIRKTFIINIHVSNHDIDERKLNNVDKNNKIVLVPSYEYIEEFLHDLIYSPITITKNVVPNIETIILLGIYNNNNRKKNRWVKIDKFNENEYFKKNVAMLNYILRKIKGPMEELVKHYEKYEFLIQEECESLINKDNIDNIDEICKIVEKFYNVSKSINSAEYDTYEILPFIINGESLRILLYNRTKAILNNFNKILCEKLKSCCITLSKNYEKRHSHLLLNPGQDVDQWVILRDTIKECTNDYQWYNKDLTYIKKLWDILYCYNVNINTDISDLYWITIAWPKKILEELDVSTKILMSSKEDIINSINNNREYIQSSITAYLNEIQEYNKLDKYYEYDMLQKMIIFRERINNIKSKIKNVIDQEKKLELEVTDFSNFNTLYYYFDGHETLWSFCDEYNKTMDKWNESFFCVINADEVICTVNKWNKTICKVCSIFEGCNNPMIVIKKYQEQLKDYYQFLPIIISLRNPSLQQKHWDKISQTIGLSQTDINTLHLKDIFMMNFELVQDILIEISQNATNELKLQKKLEAFKQKLMSKSFVVNKKFKPYIVIENFHYISQVFEDYLIKGEKLGQLLTTDSEQLIENLAQWNKKVLQCLNFLNQWEHLQTYYLKIYSFFQKYKRNIFYEQNVLNEYDHISKLMSLISDILDKNIKCMMILGRTDIYEMIVSSIPRIEKIITLLGSYINDIRDKFPRFYFIPDKTLVKIITNSSSIDSINHYINKYYNSILKLDVEVKESENEIIVKNDDVKSDVINYSGVYNNSLLEEKKFGNLNNSKENDDLANEKISNVVNNKASNNEVLTGDENIGSSNDILNMTSFNFDSFNQNDKITISHDELNIDYKKQNMLNSSSDYSDKSNTLISNSKLNILPLNNNNNFKSTRSLIVSNEKVNSSTLESINNDMYNQHESIDSIEQSISEEIPINSYVTGIYSVNNEFVKLKNDIKIEGHLYEWLKSLDTEIIHSLREYLFEVVKNKDYEEDIDKWIFYAPSQIIILAIQIIYTKLIDNSLESSSCNYMKQITHVSSKCNTDTLKLVNLLIKNECNIYQQYMIEIILGYLNYYRETINNLKGADNNGTLLKYEWLEKIRYYIEGTNVYVKVFNYKVSYEFNYVGTYQRLILSNQQIDFRSTLITSLNFSNFNTYISSTESGKTESLISFTKSLGRELIILNCTKYTNPVNIARIFKGYLLTGFWILFKGLQKCSNDFLSVFLQYIKSLKQGIDANINSNKSTIVYFNKEYELKPYNCIFTSLSLQEKMEWSPIHSSLKRLFRTNSIQIPDITKIYEIILQGYGFKDYILLSRKIVLFMNLYASYFCDNRKYTCNLKTIKKALYSKLKKLNKNRVHDENSIIARILNDIYLPQIQIKELVLYRSLLKEIFGFNEKNNSAELTERIEESCNALNYSPIKILTQKIEQLYNSIDSGKVIVLLGPTLSGKTTSLKILEDIMKRKFEINNEKIRAHNIEIIKKYKPELDKKDSNVIDSKIISNINNNNNNNVNENIDSIYYIDNNSDISDNSEDELIYGSNNNKVEEPFLKETKLKIHYIYPNACKPEEIYGCYNADTRTYSNGIIESIIESVNENENDVSYAMNNLNPIEKTWICLDNNGYPYWLDSLFSQVEDKKLAYSVEMNDINISSSITFICETNDISTFTPSFFSKSFIISYSVSQKISDSIVVRRVNQLDEIFKKQIDLFKILYHLFMKPSISFITNNCNAVFDIHPCIYIDKIFGLLESLIDEMTVKSFYRLTTEEQKCWIIITTLFCVIWVIGSLDENNMRKKFDEFVKSELLKQETIMKLQKFNSLSSFCLKNMIIFPYEGTVYDYYFDNKLLRWKKWEAKELDTFLFPSIYIGCDNIIRTKETLRVLYINRLLLKNNKIPLIIGKHGVGKSITAWTSINYKRKEIAENSEAFSIHLNSNYTIDMFKNFIIQNLYKKRPDAYGLSKNKKNLVLIDDLNNIECNYIKHSSIIELLRQWFEIGGWYIKNKFCNIEDVILIFTASTCNSFKSINHRLLKKFHCISIDDDIDSSFKSIISSILDNNFRNVKSFKSAFNLSLTEAMKNVFNESRLKFPQTVTNPHYIIRLKDAVDIIHGVIEYSKEDIEQINILKIWNYHCNRVIKSKLNTLEDQEEFYKIMKTATESTFDIKYEDICNENEPYYYFQYSIYKENEKEQKTVILQVDNINKFFKIFMNKLLMDKLNPFSFRNSKDLFKWLYPNALKSAIILSRYLEISGSHILLIGNNEFDHSKIIRLAASLNNNNYIKYEGPELNEETFDNWREFIRDVIIKILIGGKPIFLFIPEYYIKYQYQVNDIDSLMTVGFIYDLYGNNNIPLFVVTNLVSQLNKEGYDESIIIDNLPATLILLIKRNLHIVISTNINNPLRELDYFRSHSSFLSKCSPFLIGSFDKSTQLYISSSILGNLKDELSSNIEDIQTVSIDIYNSIAKTLSVYNKQYKQNIKLSNKYYMSFVEYFSKFYKLKNSDIEGKLSMFTKLIEKIEHIYDLGKDIKNEYYQWVKNYEQHTIKIQLFLKEIESENGRLSKVSQQIKKEDNTVSLIKKQITKLQDELENDCKKPLDLIDEAIDQIENLTDDCIKDLNFISKPSENEKIVIQTLCIVLNIEPNENETLWNAGKRNICEKELIDKIKYFETDTVTQTVIHYIDIMIYSKKFDLDDLLENSVAVGAYASWILAIRSYCHLFHIILPKKKKITIWEQKLEMKNKQINELREYENKQNNQLKDEKNKYDLLIKEKEKILEKLKNKEENYMSSRKIIKALTFIEQNIRNKILKLRENKEMLIGDCLCASFIITYTGRFPRNIKNKIIKPMLNILSSNEISFSTKHFSLTKFTKGSRWIDIPANTEIPESLSFLDNLLQVKLNDNWCIISDKHLVFHKYYCMFDEKEKVDICSIKDIELNRKLIFALEKGHTFILLLHEKTTGDLPFFIRKLIKSKYFHSEKYKNKHNFSFSGITENVIISPDFRLHLLITKPIEMVDPKFLKFLEPIYIDVPEELITNILVNNYFNKFDPGFNKNRKENTKNISKIFDLINKNIQEMYEIINTLEKKDLYIGQNYEKLNKKNEEFIELNQKYENELKNKEEFNIKLKWITNLCKHGSWLFQLMSKFSNIDSSYQFNLNNYLELVVTTFTECPVNDEETLQEIRKRITKASYDIMSLVLKYHDRIVFAFIISLTNVFYNKVEEYSISEKLWNYFLNKNENTFYQINENVKKERSDKVIVRPNSIYSDGTDLDLIAAKYDEIKRNIPWITEEKWNLLLNLSKLDQFSKVPFDILKSLNVMNNNSRNDMISWDSILNYDISSIKLPQRIDNSLKAFEKILLSYYIRPHSLSQSIERYIEAILGEEYTDIDQNIFEIAYNTSTHHRPIIIYINFDENNADYYIRSFSYKKGMTNKIKYIVFNNNLDEVNNTLDEGMAMGYWVIFTNCENYTEWFKEFEEKFTMFKCNNNCRINPYFRLWIIFNNNSEKQLPYNYVQNCVKIINNNTDDFRFQFNEAVSLIDNIFSPANIASLNTYQIILYKLCLFYTIITLSIDSGSIILNNNLLFKMKDLRVAGQQLNEIFSSFIKNSGSIKTVQNFVKGMIFYKNFQIQTSYIEDVEILSSYFDDIMNIPWKTQNSNSKQSFFTVKINPIISNIMNQDLQNAFESLQNHDIDKVHKIILSMNKKKNLSSCFGIGNYLKKEKNKNNSMNIMKTIKKLYIEDINEPCEFLWTSYDKIKSILTYYLDLLNKKLMNTIFNSEKYSLEDLEKNLKITRYLDHVLLDNVKHYFNLLQIVKEYFNRWLDSDYIFNPKYNDFANNIINNILPYEFKIENIGYPTQLNLNSWIDDFISRMSFIQSWYEREAYQNPLIAYDLSKIYNPGLFIIAILQDYARQTHSSYENVKFDIMLINVDQIKPPDRGIYIKGLKLVGANWDYSRGILTDNLPHESVNLIPCIWLQPHIKFNNHDFVEIEPSNTTSQFQRYRCPVYLFITKNGYTNEFNYSSLYITTLELSIDNSTTYWSEKNVCMICEYAEDEEEFNILKLADKNN
ncbi:hypothetical protein BCR36DRAFT_414609 [Piromyces finnis]|uniref:Dynein heavy chain n=1 Tax=Piromyces finnis TaxID=1754191 RepID=A0A1Y1V1D4_9FUNG|nr:hypothetical protein BCR36DRAFT_414609 [Piromyces finnis]|eukprot:ORX45145.1 hypothetical protein BCR36DRAFT_414609 [Piromyces finnis]